MTSWIQTTATLGLFVSLGVILITRKSLGEEAFGAWGWRLPFIISIFLVGISLWIRFSLRESPMYAKLKQKGATSKNPLRESFGNPVNLRYVALALFGATMGQGVIWYTGQFYALYYMQNIFKVDLVTSNLVVGAALLIGTPFFLFFGNLSDKIGRKRIMLTGMVLAVLLYYPIYGLMASFAPKAGQLFLFPYIGYNPVMLSILILVQVILVTMVYGPIAAFLVELFPTKIRYTSMSLPYHIGNGVFGGLVPIIGLSLIKTTGNDFAGLWYPIGIAAICAVVCYTAVPETAHVNIEDELNGSCSRNGSGCRIGLDRSAQTGRRSTVLCLPVPIVTSNKHVVAILMGNFLRKPDKIANNQGEMEEHGHQHVLCGHCSYLLYTSGSVVVGGKV